jgi:hypothetical protein
VKKKHIYFALALLVSLFIYVFYRTEKTVINQLLISIFSQEKYDWARNGIRANIVLDKFIIYSLPEGLWVFCITLTSRYYYMQVGRLMLNGAYIPISFAVGLELCQFFGVTPGRFDLWDIGLSLVFWWLGLNLDRKELRLNFLSEVNRKSLCCLSSYGIVYLAHVIR